MDWSGVLLIYPQARKGKILTWISLLLDDDDHSSLCPGWQLTSAGPHIHITWLLSSSMNVPANLMVLLFVIHFNYRPQSVSVYVKAVKHLNLNSLETGRDINCSNQLNYFMVGWERGGHVRGVAIAPEHNVCRPPSHIGALWYHTLSVVLAAFMHEKWRVLLPSPSLTNARAVLRGLLHCQPIPIKHLGTHIRGSK